MFIRASELKLLNVGTQASLPGAVLDLPPGGGVVVPTRVKSRDTARAG